MKELSKELKKNHALFLMLIPAFIYFIILFYIPMAGSIVAFKDFDFGKGIFKSEWVGFSNFRFFFISGNAWTVTRNTFLYNVMFLTTSNFFQMLIALFMSELVFSKFKKITQSFLFLPHFISWVVVGAFAYNIFNYEYGIVNNILTSLGGKPIDIYSTPQVWPALIGTFNLWKTVGYGSILYLSAIMGIDMEIYEAATIDGASIWARIKHITLPMLMPTLSTLLLLGVGQIFRGHFDMFYQLVGDNGQLYKVTDVIDTFVFRTLITSFDFGMSSASALYQSVICFATIMSVNFVVKKLAPDYALF